jgi:hypothetical protein
MADEQNSQSGTTDTTTKTGGDGQNSAKEGGSDNKKSTDTPGNDAGIKTITQDELSRIAAKEKRQGRNAVLKELGIDPKDSQAFEKAKAMIEGTKSNEQKAVEKKVGESTAVQDAERRAMLAEAKVEAMRLGVQPQFVDDAITLIMAKAEESDDLKTLLVELKIKYPGWFSADENSDGNKNATGQKGTGSSVKPNGSKSIDGNGIVERLAAQRKSEAPKGAFWK